MSVISKLILDKIINKTYNYIGDNYDNSLDIIINIFSYI